MALKPPLYELWSEKYVLTVERDARASNSSSPILGVYKFSIRCKSQHMLNHCGPVCGHLPNLTWRFYHGMLLHKYYNMYAPIDWQGSVSKSEWSGAGSGLYWLNGQSSSTGKPWLFQTSIIALPPQPSCGGCWAANIPLANRIPLWAFHYHSRPPGIGFYVTHWRYAIRPTSFSPLSFLVKFLADFLVLHFKISSWIIFQCSRAKRCSKILHSVLLQFSMDCQARAQLLPFITISLLL